MTEDRSRYGLLLAALGAVLLAISVFLPWYGVSLTPAGVASIERVQDEAIAQFGNGALQQMLPTLHAGVGALAGREVGALTARQAIGGLSTVLLVLAGLALLDALIPLVRSAPVPAGAGGALLLLGLAAGACAVFRLLAPPAPAGEMLALAPREGAWLALVAAVMIGTGGVWPRRTLAPPAPEPRPDRVWAQLSGWTPPG